jgi:hypothetical protein
MHRDWKAQVAEIALLVAASAPFAPVEYAAELATSTLWQQESRMVARARVSCQAAQQQ